MGVSRTRKMASSLLTPVLALALTAGQCGSPGSRPPSLAGLADRSAPMGEPLDVQVTIADDDPGSVTLEASSNDASLVPDADIEVVGEGSERTLRITPSPLGIGTVEIAVEARDAAGLAARAAFALELRAPYTVEVQELAAADPAGGEWFGGAVAIGADYVFVGSLPYHSGRDPTVHVFRRRGEDWEPFDRLTPSDATGADEFGASLALDGDHAIVGAPTHEDRAEGTGAAYVFALGEEGWNEVEELPPSDPVVGLGTAASDDERLGASVAIDGVRAVAGARFDSGQGDRAGSAYLFERCVPLTRPCRRSWSLDGEVYASDGSSDDWFGASVAVSGDYALIGAPWASSDGGGAAYVFRWDGSAWSEATTLEPSDGGESDDLFGWAVALDGATAMVGAPGHDASGDASDDGAVFLFARGDGGWSVVDRFDGAPGDELGWSVALDGDHAIAGAPVEQPPPDRADPATGSAYVFKRHEGAWTQVARIVPSDGAESDRFGASVALAADHAIVGAPRTAPPLSELQAVGSVYVFRR